MQKLLTILCAFWVGACGFEPLYGDQNSRIVTNLSDVALTAPQDRLYQQMNNHLSDLIHPLGPSANRNYELSYILSETTQGFGFTQNGAVSRERYTLSLTFELMEVASGDIIYRDQLTTGTTFDVVQSDFATLSAREDAQRRALENAANGVVLKLSIFFEGRTQH